MALRATDTAVHVIAGQVIPETVTHGVVGVLCGHSEGTEIGAVHVVTMTGITMVPVVGPVVMTLMGQGQDVAGGIHLEEGGPVIVPIMVMEGHHAVAGHTMAMVRTVAIIRVPAAAIVGVDGINPGHGETVVTIVAATGATAIHMGRMVMVILAQTVMVILGDVGSEIRFVASGAGSFMTRARKV